MPEKENRNCVVCGRLIGNMSLAAWNTCDGVCDICDDKELDSCDE